MDCFWPRKCCRCTIRLHSLAVRNQNHKLAIFHKNCCKVSYVMGAIDIVQSVVGIYVCIGCRRSSVPCNIHSVLSSSNIVIYFKPKKSRENLLKKSNVSLLSQFLLVSMRMTIELGTDNHVESINNATILTRPELHTAAATSWYVG